MGEFPPSLAEVHHLEAIGVCLLKGWMVCTALYLTKTGLPKSLPFFARLLSVPSSSTCQFPGVPIFFGTVTYGLLQLKEQRDPSPVNAVPA